MVADWYLVIVNTSNKHIIFVNYLSNSSSNRVQFTFKDIETLEVLLQKLLIMTIQFFFNHMFEDWTHI